MSADGASARDAVLAAVRAGLHDVPDTATPDDAVARHYRRESSVDDLVDTLRDRLTASDTEVTTCPADEVARRVGEALRDVGEGPVVVPPGLPREWRPEGVELRDDDEEADARELADFSAAVTGCAVAIAETGTIVLDAGAVSGRRLLSLVPDTHVCVVREEDIVPDVPQALAAITPTDALTFVSGPSATVDVELVRTVGVHGPRTLKVVVVTR